MNIEGLKSVDFDSRIVPNPVKPVVFVSGRYYEMGVQYGLQQKELIRRNASLALAEAIEIQGDREAVFENTVKYRDITFEKAPEIVEMWEGISDGAEVPFEQIVLLNCKIPISYGAKRCSAIAAWGRATENGETIAAGNVDGRRELAYFGVILIAHPHQGNAVIASVDLAGQVCSGFCINDKGVMAMMTGGQTGRTEDRQDGYDPTGVAIKSLFSGETAEEALEIARELKIFAGLSMIFADKGGSAYAYEHTSAVEAVRRPGDFGEGDYIGIANHYMCEEMQEAHEEPQSYEDSDVDSRVRYAAEGELIKGSYGRLNVEGMCDILSCNDLWDQEKEEWIENFIPSGGYEKENECEPNMRGIIYQTTATCCGKAETGQLWVRVGCRDRFMSYMPQYLGEFTEISLEKSELESVNYAEKACCEAIWKAGRKLSMGDKENIKAMEFLRDAKIKLWEAQNEKTKGKNSGTKGETLLHYGNAATGFMLGQAMAKAAESFCG